LQPPQLLASVDVSVQVVPQQALVRLPASQKLPWLDALHAEPSQTPATHALPPGHAIPQAPQLLASSVRSEQASPQQVPIAPSRAAQ